MREVWSFRTLQRNVSSHYLTDTLDYIKNPVIAEFLGLSGIPSYTESDLVTAIINNIQKIFVGIKKRQIIILN